MTAILRQRVEQVLSNGMLGQLVRFGIVGGISTLVYAAVYLPLVYYVMPENWAVGAVPFAFAVAAAVGFPLHSLWSFRGHGARDSSGRQHAKFVVTQASGLAMNMGFTWVLVDRLDLADWIPLIPAVTVVPVVTFVINRQWVFAER